MPTVGGNRWLAMSKYLRRAGHEVEIDYTGRPGVHSDGDETTEGWFRSNTPVDDGGFVTTEPMGTEDWIFKK